MMSSRHNAYLDAARSAILDVGWKRTTLTDVARRADVSRMTIYRAWPDMRTLLSDLMTREWAAVIASVPEPDGPPGPERIAAGVVAAVRALRSNPLFRRILDVDPELLLPYLLDRRGRSQQAILDVVADRIADGQAAGLVRDGDPALLARTILLAAHGLTISAHTMTDETEGAENAEALPASAIAEDDLDQAFGSLLARGLQP